jgi:hypothetical protein
MTKELKKTWNYNEYNGSYITCHKAVRQVETQVSSYITGRIYVVTRVCYEISLRAVLDIDDSENL